MKKKLILPKFKNENEERDFWMKIDLSEYYEPGDMVPISFPNLKPTTHPISIRIPEYLLKKIGEFFLGIPDETAEAFIFHLKYTLNMYTCQYNYTYYYPSYLMRLRINSVYRSPTIHNVKSLEILATIFPLL